MQRTFMVAKGKLSLLTMTLILAGCTVGPDYRAKHDEPLILSQPLDQKLYSNERLQREWWRQFQDPQLNQAIDLALRNNQDIQIAQARLLEARAALDERQLDRLPNITSGISYTRSLSQENPGVVGEPNVAKNYRGALDMQWEVDLFGRLQRISEAAMARSQASEDDLAQVQIIVTADVARNYFQMRGAQKKMEIAHVHLTNQQQTVRVVEAMVAAGRGQGDELASARAERARVEASLAPMTEQYYLARYKLAVLMGLRPNDVEQVIPKTPLPTLSVRLPIGDVGELLRQRPDVASAERSLAASTADVGAATAELYPRINLGGFIGFVAIRGGDIPNGDSRAFGIMPSIDWPALHFATVKAKQRQAQARLQGAEARHRQTVLQAIEETEGALMRYSQSQQRLQALTEAVSESRRAATLAEVRYKAGGAPYLTSLAADRTRLSAEESLAEADTETFIDIVMVYKALGGGWSAVRGAL